MQAPSPILEQARQILANRPAIAFGPMPLQSRYLLSPLAGYTNLAFRRVVRSLGGLGLGTTDLVNARALIEQRPRSLEMIDTTPDDSPLAVQIFGGDPKLMCDAARMLYERGIPSIDINMGCPVERITKVGGGAGMMCKQQDTIDLVRQVVEAVPIPVTVKMRLGWDETALTAPFYAREFEQCGITAVMIHGRTRAQGFRGTVDRDGIRQVVEAVEKIPVIGNGDVRTVEDAARMIVDTHCAGVSVGRGALTNPWIFRQLQEWEQTGQWSPVGSFDQRLELVFRQYQYLREQFAEAHALVHFKRTVHWYLKAMRVRSSLRQAVQVARTEEAFTAAMQLIMTLGPKGRERDEVMPEIHIPVPQGPIEHW
jgi:nifR3 family TIM-barrel protein